jgi:hypothetical protein
VAKVKLARGFGMGRELLRCVLRSCMAYLPPPRQKVCKVFEIKELGLDSWWFVVLKSKARLCAGLGFFLI